MNMEKPTDREGMGGEAAKGQERGRGWCNWKGRGREHWMNTYGFCSEKESIIHKDKMGQIEENRVL